MVVRRSQSASIRHSSTSSQVSSSSVTTASRKTISNPSLSIDKDKDTFLPRWCSYFGKHNKNNNNKTSLLTAIMKRPATTSLLLTTSLSVCSWRFAPLVLLLGRHWPRFNNTATITKPQNPKTPKPQIKLRMLKIYGQNSVSLNR